MSGEKVLFPDAIISELSSSWRHGFSCIRLPQVLWLRHQTFFLLGSQHWGKAVLWGSEGFNRGETRGLEVQLHPGSSSFNWVWGADGTPGSCSFYGSRRHLVDEPRQVLAEQFSAQGQISMLHGFCHLPTPPVPVASPDHGTLYTG